MERPAVSTRRRLDCRLVRLVDLAEQQQHEVGGRLLVVDRAHRQAPVGRPRPGSNAVKWRPWRGNLRCLTESEEITTVPTEINAAAAKSSATEKHTPMMAQCVHL
jgi:hypothetical protein